MRRLTYVIGILAAALISTPAIGAQTTERDKPAKAAAPSAPVNLNTASVAQLEGLPGVGAGTAKRIIEYRQKNGAFKKIEELMNVKGMGEKSFLKLKPLIIVAPDKGERAGGVQ